MAHTLSITYGETPTTISLSGSGASAGISLGDGQGSGGYQPSEAVRDVVYNASLYQDGNRPVFDRAANIRETFTVTIKGSSVDDMLSRLRALKYAVWTGRDYMLMPGMRNPTYIAFKPSGATNTAYSTVLGGDVQEPDMLQTEIVNYTIHNVRVTIEREPFWRDKAPARGGTSTAYMNDLINPTKTNAGNFNAYHYGSFYIDNSTYAEIPGDIPALAELKVSSNAGASPNPTIAKMWAGYRSELRYPPTRNGVAVFAGGALEASASTNGTDCSNTTDTALDPGTGNTGKQITFATKTNAKRMTFSFSAATSLPVGSYRVFIKWKSATSNSVTAYLSYYFLGSTAATTPSTTFTVPTTDQVNDLGVISFGRAGMSLSDPAVTLSGGFIEVYMSATNTYTLSVDHLFLIPCDEYFLTMSGDAMASFTEGIRASTVEPGGPAYPIQVALLTDTGTGEYEIPSQQLYKSGGTGTGVLYLPPGKGKLFYIVADASNKNVYSATASVRLSLKYVARYLTARGAS